MERLNLNEEQRNQLKKLQAEVREKMDDILTDDQKQMLRRMRDQGPGARPDGPPREGDRRDGDRREGFRGPRDGQGPPPRGPRDGEGPPRRGPRDGDRDGDRERGPRDGDRERGPRDGDRDRER